MSTEQAQAIFALADSTGVISARQSADTRSIVVVLCGELFENSFRRAQLRRDLECLSLWDEVRFTTTTTTNNHE
jgi:hypothetical protein